MIPPTPFQDAVLDEATLGQLFFDVGHAAELIAVIQKGVGARHADRPTTPTGATAVGMLDAAHAALREGRIAGVQLRYRFGGEEWWDTLTMTTNGVRLIRISHSRALAAPNLSDGVP